MDLDVRFKMLNDKAYLNLLQLTKLHLFTLHLNPTLILFIFVGTILKYLAKKTWPATQQLTLLFIR